MVEKRTGAILGFLAVGTIALIAWNWNRLTVYHPSEFFRPDLVADIAACFPEERDDFILSAWSYVANIPYEAIGSDMYIGDSTIECADCHLPEATLQREIGNCVSKSALLASILVTRLPAEQVHIIIGSYKYEDIGGHSWVEVYRDGAWYLLETTREPNMENPWLLADESYPLYDPGVLITSTGVSCEDEKYCQAIPSCNCANIANYKKA